MRPLRNRSESRPPLIIITGPTGIGKSEVGMRLARLLDTEIISADSLQVYKYFNIGSAKPLQSHRDDVPHHLIDILEPDQEYNANLFRGDAEKIIGRLHDKGKVPLVVGGTGLYIKSISENLGCAIKPSQTIREKVREEINEKGAKTMHRELAQVDPDYAMTISPKDRQRLARGLEVYRATGKSLSAFHKEDEENVETPYHINCIVLNASRELLYSKIDGRVDSMLRQGLLEEARSILARGYSRELKPFAAIGYKQALVYFDGGLDYRGMVDSIKQETRKYAKRQLTWFRKTRGAEWIEIEEGEGYGHVAERILKTAR